MPNELIISIILSLATGAQIRFLSLKRDSLHNSYFKKIITGLISWFFFISIIGWMVLFGDAIAAWLIAPDDDLFFDILISSVVFLCLYVLSFRKSAPYPATDTLVFALLSLNFQSEALISTNKLILSLRRRAFNEFLQQVQPDSHEYVIQRRENLINQLGQQQMIADGMHELEKGESVNIIDATRPFPNTMSRHPYLKYLKRLTIDPQKRKAYLQLVYTQILESVQLTTIDRVQFLRQVYEFVQAIAHEPFLMRYSKFINMFSLSMHDSLNAGTSKNINEPLFLFEISATVLQKHESTYINPLKLDTIATVQFRSDDSVSHEYQHIQKLQSPDTSQGNPTILHNKSALSVT